MRRVLASATSGLRGAATADVRVPKRLCVSPPRVLAVIDPRMWSVKFRICFVSQSNNDAFSPCQSCTLAHLVEMWGNWCEARWRGQHRRSTRVMRSIKGVESIYKSRSKRGDSQWRRRGCSAIDGVPTERKGGTTARRGAAGMYTRGEGEWRPTEAWTTKVSRSGDGNGGCADQVG